MTQETRTRYEVIKEAFEARNDVESSDIFDALLEEGVKNGSYEVIGYADTLAEAREMMSEETSSVKNEATFASSVKSAYVVYAEEQEYDEGEDEWIPTGSYESAQISE